MINNFHDFRFFNAIHCLRFLIMIHQDDPFFTHAHEPPPGYKSFKITVAVQDWEITELLLRHNFLNILHIIIHVERHQWFCTHKISDRHALINQTRRCKSIIRRLDNHNTLFLRLRQQLLRHFCILAKYNTACINIYRTSLRFIPVAQNYQVILPYKLFHHLRTGSSDRDLSLHKIAMLIPTDKGPV